MDIDQVSRDLLYVKHYPNSEKYVSILMPATDENAARIERVRSAIETKLRNEAIVMDADEGAGLGHFGAGARAEEAEPSRMAQEDDFFLGEGEEEGEEGGQPLQALAPLALPDSSDDDDDEGDGDNGYREEERAKDESPAVSGAEKDGGRAGLGRGGIRGEPRGRAGSGKRKPGSGVKEERHSRGRDGQKSSAKETTPARTRAVGGRKRRRKKSKTTS